MSRVNVVVGIVLLTATVCSADVIHVPADSPTIQIAIQKAEPFDRIIVAPGTYYEAIDFSGKVITVQSEDPNDPAVVASTIIGAGGLGTVVSFSGGADHRDTLLAGLTITGGTIGIDANGSSATIRNCIVRDNSGVGIRDADGIIAGCTVQDNGDAGLLGCDGIIEQCAILRNFHAGIRNSDAEIRDCMVTETRGASTGGDPCFAGHGICHCDGEILRTVARNSRGGGFYSCDGSIRNCISSGNGLDGFAVCHGSIVNSVSAGNRLNGFWTCEAKILSSTVTANGSYGFNLCSGPISHVILWDNEEGAFVNSSTPVSSGTFNPFFLLPGFRDNASGLWVDGNYNLAPESAYIDIGDPFYGDDPQHPSVDLAGNPRIAGARVDIGAYEFQVECDGPDFDGDKTPDLCDSDIDNDGVTNVPDQCDFTPSGIAVDGEGRPHADMNLDCRVDLRDYAVFQRSIFE